MSRYLIGTPGLVVKLLWKIWTFIQTTPRWMKTLVLAYIVLTQELNTHISLMIIAAEILAIKKAAEIVRKLCNSITESVTIYVDSQVTAINPSTIKSEPILTAGKSSLKHVIVLSIFGLQARAI